MRSASLLLFAAASMALVASSQPAQGQAPENDARAEAARLFSLGKSQLDAKQYEEACANLAKSDALDPTVGTLGMLAACHEMQGRLATAYREYQETAKRARIASDRREDYAEQRAAALKSRVPVIVVRAEREEQLEVAVDRNLVAFGEEVMVDPGTHEVSARAPGKKQWQTSVTIEEQGRREVVVPVLPELLGGPNATPSTAPTSKRPAASPDESDGSGRRVAGFVLLGVGAAGLLAAGITGAMILDRAATVDEECAEDRCRSAEGYDAATSGQTLMIVNTIAWGAGLLGAGAGIFLLVTSSSSGEPAARAGVSMTGATIGYRGRF